MVKYLTFLLCLPVLLFSAEFTARVNRNQVALGEGLTLSLTLKEASTQKIPSLDILKKAFVIHSQQQMMNTRIINGQITSSMVWKISLLPQKEGEITIPALSIDTSEGVFESQPITITVVKGTADTASMQDVILAAELDNEKPYKNEPVIYAVKIVSERSLTDIAMQKFNVENAIVEAHGEPKIYRKKLDGSIVNVIEFDYLITPLKSGSLKIPPAAVQGMVAMRDNGHSSEWFSDNDFGAFPILRGFERFKPFTLTTEEVVLEVQNAIVGMSPWLPVKSFEIKEIWNGSQDMQVGEPFTRTFEIKAEGIKSSQLPNLYELQAQDKNFKMYADKPELKDDENSDTIKSYRKEQYTIVPQKSGNLTLPELKIEWWDVTKKEKRIASIPSRSIQVLPGFGDAEKQEVAAVEPSSTPILKTQIQVESSVLLLVLIGGLSIVLTACVAWIIILQRKMRRLAQKTVAAVSVSNKNEKLPELNPIHFY